MFAILDVSKWQKLIDFDKLVASVEPLKIDGVIIRVGYGTRTLDLRAHRNASLAKQAGLPIGFYWYAPEPLVSVSQVYKITQKLKDWAAIYKPELPLFLDVEGEQRWEAKDILNKLLFTYIKDMNEKGLYPGLYGSEQVLYKHVNAETLAPGYNWSRWVAKYSSKEPKCYWDIWQYSSNGQVPGIDGNVDLNRCKKDYKKIIKERKLNGWTS